MAKNCRIYETLNSVSEMKVEKKNGLMTLSGTFGVCGVRNNNQRVYETGNYGERVKELQSQINENGGVPGELEHPDSMNINLENISHKVTKIAINEEGVVSGEIQLLNTPKGKIAQAIVEGGLPLFVSSRATGQVGKDGMVTLEKLCTYDLVGSPGFSQARMHLNESQICESITDNITIISEGTEIEENNNNDMNNEELTKILEEVKELRESVESLQAENESLQDTVNEMKSRFDIKKLADGIEKWIVEEFAPEVQNWVNEEFAPEQQKQFKEYITEKVAPAIEKWVVEEYSPEVEKWVVEQYSPEVQNWFCNEVAPGIQNWLLEQYTPEVENWMNECYSKKIEGMVSEGIKETKDNKLKTLTETIELLESIDVKKPVYGSNMINEQVTNEPLYIQQMPEQYRPQYNMASQELKESIARRAMITNFANEGAIERFWEKIDFNAEPAKPVTESLDKFEDEQERMIRSMFRRNRRF